MKVAQLVSTNPKCGITKHADMLVEWIDGQIDVEVVKFDISIVRTGGFLEQRRYFRELAKRLNQTYDLVHIQHEYGLWGRKVFYFHYNLWNFVTHLTVPCVLTWHSIVPELLTSIQFRKAKPDAFWKNNPLFKNLKYRLYKKYMIETFSSIQSFIVHSTISEELFQEKVPNQRTLVLPLGIPLRAGIEQDRRDQIRDELGIAKEEQCLVLFGFVSPYKGHETAIRALRLLPERVKLVIAGGSHPMDEGAHAYMRKIVRVAHNLDVRERLIITGFLAEEEVDKWQLAADLVLAPYTDDNLSASGAIGRAFAVGNGILASDIPAFLEIAERTPGVRIFPREDHKELAKRIYMIFSDPDRLNSMQAANLEFAELNSTERVVATHLSLYRSLLGQGEEKEVVK